ncbi:MAG: hypothetical protein ACYDB7_01845 [Mycobacteriales bacterium]
MRRLVLAVGVAMVFGLTSVGALASGAPGPTAGASPGLALVGQVPYNGCSTLSNAARAVIDPTDDTLVEVEVDFTPPGGASCFGMPGPGAWLVTWSAQTLKPRATVRLGLPVGANEQSSSLVSIRLDPARHRLWTLTSDNDVSTLAAFSLDGLRELADVGGTLRPLETIALPAVVSPNGPDAVDSNDPAVTVGTVVSGFTPLDLAVDPATDTLDVLQYTGGQSLGVPPTLSKHGPAAGEPYVFHVSAATHQTLWIAQLGNCVGAQAGANPGYPQLMRLHTSSGDVLAGGCSFTNGPYAGRQGPQCAPSNVGGPATCVSVPGSGGSMLAWVLPLDHAGAPAGPVQYYLGRPGFRGALADPQTGRIFFETTPPPGGSGTAQAGSQAVVFDVAHRVYLGESQLSPPEGGIAYDAAYAVAGGLLLGVGPGAVTIGEAGATPPGQPLALSGYQCATARVAVPLLLDPASRHLFVVNTQGCTLEGGLFEDYFQVFSYPPPPPPAAPPPNPDSYTTQLGSASGPTFAQFTGHGEATAVRLRLQGGSSGLLRGATFGAYDANLVDSLVNPVLPAADQQYADYADHELDLGVVQSATLDNYEAAATAQAATVDAGWGGELSGSQSQGNKVGGGLYPQATCSGSAGQTQPAGATSGDPQASVTCTQNAQAVSASSHAGLLGLAVRVTQARAPQTPGAATTTLPLQLGSGNASTQVSVEPAAGLVAQTTASEDNVLAARVHLGQVVAQLSCTAHGQRHTAG